MRRPPAWFILMGLLGMAGAFFALLAFPLAFPLVDVDLRMDRGSALEAAAALATEEGWGTEGFRSAASFGDADPGARIFLELEAEVPGTRTPEVLAQRGLSAWTWRVRHVREREAREVVVHFTPGGEPYRFRLTLPEDAPGPDLPAPEARALAEAEGVRWGFDPSLHEPVEASRTLRPGGRGDHTFVYRRTGSEVEEADARIRLVVAGDQLAAVEPFLQVPEAFERRFEAMRAGNQRIAFAASAFFLLVLVGGGCGIGIFYLIRHDAVAWRPSLALGGVISFLLAMAAVNGLPLAWMGYDSALPEGTFLLLNGVLAPLGIFAAGTLFFGWVIASAEGLGRLAFPHHPAFWRVWSREAAPSRQVMGSTVGGYLVAGLELGFVVGFYILVSRWDGWWSPAEALVSPDLLATYQPWVAAVSLALTAGVWEEAVFRAVPLAGAALLGRRFGKPVLWIGTALVLQAVVFAAAHADYPQQPAYARVLELTPSALLWGFIYLRYGLLPVILIHAIYNLTLFSLPLFAADSPGLAVQQGIVIALGLLPLAIVLWRRAQHGPVELLAESDLNRGWRPDAGGAPSGGGGETAEGDSGALAGVGGEGGHATTDERSPLPGGDTAGGAGSPAGNGGSTRPPVHLPLWLPPALLVAGVALWLGTRPSLPPDLRLGSSGRSAEALVLDTLRGQGVEVDDFTTSVRPVAGWGAQERFLRREEGPAAVARAVEGGFLPRPAWLVRLARFEGPLEERAEEWRAEVEGDSLRRVVHRLPEARPGERPTEEQARELAWTALREAGMDPEGLVEISAQGEDRPARLDWTLVFRDPGVPLPGGAEPRITVGLAGDQVVDLQRSIHLPERWTREDRERTTRWILTLLPAGMLGGGALFLAVAVGVVGLARRQIPLFPVAAVAIVLVATGLLDAVNGLPVLDATAGTTTSLAAQRTQSLVGALLGVLVLSVLLALALGAAVRLAGIHRPSTRVERNAGFGAGVLLSGVVTALNALATTRGLRAPRVDGAGDVVPWLGSLQSLPLAFVLLLTLLLLSVVLIRHLEQRLAGVGLVAAVLVGGALLLPGGADTPLLLRGAAGAGLGLTVLLLVRVAQGAGRTFLPALVAGLLVPGVLSAFLDRPYPGASAGAFVSLALLLLLARGADRVLQTVGASVAGGPPAPASPGGDPPARHASDTAP